MARVRIKVDYKGLSEHAKGREMQDYVEKVAEQVAENVRDQGITVGDKDGGSREVALPVEVKTSVTDRARASVQIQHPAGLAVQAKHGALTRAAAQAGLQVRGD